MWNIIGFYKTWRLAERDGIFYVVAKDDEGTRIVYRGSEGCCTKMFVMLVAGFIDEDSVKTEL
jgi:hypothetical protein